MPERTVYLCDSEPCPKIAANYKATMSLVVDGHRHDFDGRFCGVRHMARWLNTLPGLVAPRKPRKTA